MFVFRQDDDYENKENRGRSSKSNRKKKSNNHIDKFFSHTKQFGETSDNVLEAITQHGNCSFGTADDNPIQTTNTPSLLESSYASELSDFSLNSDDSAEDDSYKEQPTALSNLLFKPTIVSPVDRLVAATNPSTPKQDAFETLEKLRAWAVDADEVEFQRYAWDIRTRAIPELLEYIRLNVDDKECVSEALELVCQLSCHQTMDVMVLIEAHAINVLVLALQTHNNNHSATHNISLTKQKHTCLFQRLWNFLIVDIVLSPSVIKYFQSSDLQERQFYQQQKHYQKARLVTALNLCLDRIISQYDPTSSSRERFLEQIFDTATVLLRADVEKDDGWYTPNDDVRLLVWEKQIARKCQHAISTMDISFDGAGEDDTSGVAFDTIGSSSPGAAMASNHLSVRALTFFYICLCDRDDGLSESLDAEALEAFVIRALSDSLLDGESLETFVIRALSKCSRSGSVQDTACQILHKLASRRTSLTLGTTVQKSPILFPETYSTESDDDIIDNEPTTNNNNPGIELILDESQLNHSGDKKISFIDLVKAIFQKPCTCGAQNIKENFQIVYGKVAAAATSRRTKHSLSSCDPTTVQEIAC